MPTHGSLAKAGKVRSQTPKMESTPKKAESPEYGVDETTKNE